MIRMVLDVPPLYEAELRKIAADRGVSVTKVVNGIVEYYLDASAMPAEKKRGPGRPQSDRAIVDQHGTQYKNVRTAAEKLGLHERLIYHVLKGERGNTGGYTFRYA